MKIIEVINTETGEVSKGPLKRACATRDAMRVRESISFEDDPGETDQSFAEQCDVNVLLARYEKTGELPDFGFGKYIENEYDSLPKSFEEMRLLMADCESKFNQLPAAVRTKFANNAAIFYDFATDPRNQDQLIDMGLATRKPSSSLIDDPRASNAMSGASPVPKKEPVAKAEGSDAAASV